MNRLSIGYTPRFSRYTDFMSDASNKVGFVSVNNTTWAINPVLC
jgi:hypothetical protein